MRLAMRQGPRVTATAALPASVEPWRPAVAEVWHASVSWRVHCGTAHLRSRNPAVLAPGAAALHAH
jgi:hypothetical protein